MAGTDTHNARRTDWQRPAGFDVDERLIRALTTGWDMWHVPELPAELEAMIDDATLDRFTVAGTPDECADRLRVMLRDLPEATGFRVKLPRPEGLHASLASLGTRGCAYRRSSRRSSHSATAMAVASSFAAI